MDDRDDIEKTSAKVRLEEHLRCVKTYEAAVDTSEDFEAILGEALPDNVVLVLIHSLEDQVLRINPVGAATAANAGIGNGDWFPYYGKKATLDLYRLFTGVSTAYQFFVYERISGAE